MIDFHCHLDLYPDPARVVAECRARGIYVLSVTTTPSAWRGSSALVQDSPRIRLALGLHPQLAHERKTELPLFEELVATVRYVGEVGLDGSKEYKAHWEDQLEVFEKVLQACSRVGGRIISIHSRRAAKDVLQLLAANPKSGRPILHWFSGSERELDIAIAQGCWFSVGPAMLRSEKGRRLASRMPRDRLLTESDGPFAQCSGRPCAPWDVSEAERLLSDMWKMTASATSNFLNENLRKLVAG